MAAHDLYFDTARGVLVAGRNSSTIVDLPPLVRGAQIPLRCFLLKPSEGFPVSNPPYDFIPVADNTIQMAIGIFGTTSYLANQFVWTPSTDIASPYFAATLSLNTPNLTAEI